MFSFHCNSCNSNQYRFLFQKSNHLDETFFICKCKKCGLIQLYPKPTQEELKKYYTNTYFSKRTDRGYDNYYSENIKNSIFHTFELNLTDLKFFEWGKKLDTQKKKSLDIGCASGYFLEFLNSHGWETMGIDISHDSLSKAREKNLNVIEGDFLNWDPNCEKKFHLISLWASIEHLPKPKEVLAKIFKHLEPGGRIILSTCRYGILAKIRGEKWRFLNVPEHLYYYSLPQLTKLLKNLGYSQIATITYGSGMTSKSNANFLFKINKWILDKLVKLFGQGDMMALCFEKK